MVWFVAACGASQAAAPDRSVEAARAPVLPSATTPPAASGASSAPIAPVPAIEPVAADDPQFSSQWDELLRLCQAKNQYACGVIASVENDPRRAVAVMRADCKTADVPEACFIVVMNTHDVAAWDPVDFARATGAACRFHQDHCSIAKAAAEMAVGSIRGQFPEEAASFRFGEPRADAEAKCTSAGGKWRTLTESQAECVPAPATPPPRAGSVRLDFCSGNVCEVAVRFGRQPELLSLLRVHLVGLYGEPRPMDTQGLCPFSPPHRPFSGIWTDLRADRSQRLIALDLLCSEAGDGLELTLTYTNEVHIQQSLDQWKRIDEANRAKTNEKNRPLR